MADAARRAAAAIERVRSTKRLLIPVVAVAAGALTAGIVLAAGVPGSSRGASSGPKATGSATVQRQDLVATDTESGTLGYANTGTVYNRLSGTITWLPAVGQEIKAGQALFKVDNSPVILMDGSTPAFRTLSSGVSDGPDIQELNQNLIDLGFDPNHEIAVNQTWQTGTTDAVDRWQASLGETQTGTVTLGQVVFLPGPRLVASVSAVTGSAGGGSGSGSGSGAGSGQAAVFTGTPRSQFVDLTTTTAGTTDTTSANMKPSASDNGPSGSGSRPGGKSNAQLLALITLLKAEIAELKAQAASAARGGGGASGAGTGSRGGGGGGTSAGAAAGSGAGAGSSAGSGSGSSGGGAAEAVMQTTSTDEVVTVDLDATKQTEAVVGEKVTVQLPDSTTVDGKITQVSPVAQSSSSGSSGAGGGGGSSTPTATIPVTITLTGHRQVKGLDQAAVSVNFAQQRANNVLSVPVTALIATQGGGYAVQAAAPPHQLIPVTPGLFAAGYVQISGPGISEGLQVTDSQG